LLDQVRERIRVKRYQAVEKVPIKHAASPDFDACGSFRRSYAAISAVSKARFEVISPLLGALTLLFHA